MALFDIFKKKKSVPVAPAKPPLRRSEARPTSLGGKKILGESYKILKKARVTEKAADLTSKNQYIFDVFPRSNKNQIKKAVEDVYGIDVVSVRIINIPKKKRRLGRIEGWRQGYKKAIIKVREGQKIEVLPR